MVCVSTPTEVEWPKADSILHLSYYHTSKFCIIWPIDFVDLNVAYDTNKNVLYQIDLCKNYMIVNYDYFWFVVYSDEKSIDSEVNRCI